jgi:uncharacterized protein involved in exopolysaccharide biosynthesis
MSGTGNRTAEDAWVARVLGVEVPNGGAPADLLRRWEAAESAFAAAARIVDQQIDALRAVLRASENPNLRTVADSGLAELTAPMRQDVQAAIAAAGRGAEQLKSAAPALREAVESLRARLARDARIAACDENPFGVAVTIRAGYAAALDRIADVCSAVL